MKVALISGGNIQEEFALSFLKKQHYDRIIAIDRGLNFCKKYNIQPDDILGDFDSVEKEVYEYYKQNNVKMQEYSSKKDDTDTELGIKKACDYNADEIHLLGGTGSRLDHVIGNIQAMYQAKCKGVTCKLVDETNLIMVLLPGTTKVKKEEQHGTYISFLPFTDEVCELTLDGFAYPLVKYHMTKHNALGVSNELADNVGLIHFTKGALIMIQSRD